MFGVESTAPTLRLQLPAAVLILVGVFWPAVELSVEWPSFSPVTANYSWIDVPGAGGFTALLSALAALGAILRLGRSPDTLWLVMIGWALTVILTLCVLVWLATLMYAEPRVAQAIADSHGGGLMDDPRIGELVFSLGYGEVKRQLVDNIAIGLAGPILLSAGLALHWLGFLRLRERAGQATHVPVRP